MAKSSKWFGILSVCTLLAACSSGSSDDDDVAGGGSSGHAGAGGGNSPAGSGGQNAAGTGHSEAGESSSDAGGQASSGGGGEGGQDDVGACCIEEPVSWGRVGGHVATVDESSLAPCAVYTHERGPLDGPATDSCTQGLAVACGEDGLGPDDVLTALDDSEVQAAIAAAPVLFGTDPRPYDGQLFEIAIGDAVIQLGDDCTTQGCTAIPQGVQALADLLLALDDQELASAPCSTAFP